ncbi:MAG: Prolyl-tRNA synthetase [Candidatus Curtissbacteria bacterium GW2011_GWC1_44_33]|uniref:Proline--tRNA ligase n=1 Tax=Candidatus Curtissbacteria bacterium GW2011_GWC1_44_33 TaxID=1618413 RepID=A0A0G1J350_9BACT|nr:MAG: Prolyl-tRNA synthetase [Candidatus Curtissbacteria bacterium GW2011_GWC1_44_33]
MRQSKLFPKTKKEAPKEAESINHKLLVRAGFIDQLMAGSWTLLPLGWRVVTKINQVIREEMNAIGGQEMLMPLLHPREIWNETGRWDKAKEVMYQFKDSRGREYALAFTHEEIVMDLLRKHIKSYTDLPLAVYHFSTKFRNEARARSGILRGREFLMKDLYSAHVSEKDFWNYYEKVKNAYSKIFTRLGLTFRVIETGGGVFTDSHTHEFQVLAKGGEDTIYYCNKCDWGQNKEIFDGKAGGKCPKCKRGKITEAKAIEVGNIFPLGTWFAERMRVYYTDKAGMKKLVWFGSYGIGPTRVLGALVEVSHDERGIIWNPVVSPFDVHLIELPGGKAKEVYEKLTDSGVEVLWDDREAGAGEKFADADLIGIPVRLVVSDKTGSKIEYKKRTSAKTELLDFEELIKKIT